MVFLMVLHHIADVAFQPSWLIKNKGLHWWSVYEHAFIWAGLISFGLLWFDIFTWWKFIFLLVVHFLIDFTKYRKLPEWHWVYVDQGLHYLQLLIVYYL